MVVTVDIEISADGKIKIETAGHKGPACMKELAELEASLKKAGVKTNVTDQKLKAEYYERTFERARNHTQR